MSSVLECNKIKSVLADITTQYGWSDYYYFFSKNTDWASLSGICVRAFSPKMAEFLKQYHDAGIRYSNTAVLKTDMPQIFNTKTMSVTAEGLKLANFYQANGWNSALVYPTYGYGGVVGVICLAHRDLTVAPQIVNATTDALNQWRGKFNDWARALVVNQTPRRVEEQLSLRELDCMALVADGKTSSDIAKVLGITKRTVDFHIQNSILKLGVTSRSQAALMLFLDPLPQLGMLAKMDVV